MTYDPDGPRSSELVTERSPSHRSSSPTPLPIAGGGWWDGAPAQRDASELGSTELRVLGVCRVLAQQLGTFEGADQEKKQINGDGAFGASVSLSLSLCPSVPVSVPLSLSLEFSRIVLCT